MTCDGLNRLLGQVEILRKLRLKRANEGTALAAIRQCTREIEYLAADDMAADYARDIRTALETLSNGGRTGCLSQTIVGERIEHLVSYVDFVREAPEEELEYLKPWS
jgi:plasmid stabilization system protein ParE